LAWASEFLRDVSGIGAMKNQKLNTKPEARPSGSEFNDNSPSPTASNRRLLRGLPWVWIALSVLATLIWLIGIGWIAVKLISWLFD
jgi:hypothetical protein